MSSICDDNLRVVGLVLGLNSNTLLLYMMTIHIWRPCLTMESLNKFGRLIMLNSLCVFKCKWVDRNMGARTDDFGFTLVDMKKVAYQNKPFIMAE